MPIEFACPDCQKQYRVQEALAGKQAKCKACGHAMQIPVPVQPDAEEDEFRLADLPDELLKPAEGTVAVAATAVADQTCPSCKAELSPDAILCVQCGFDLRSGKKLAGAGDDEPKKDKSAKGKKKKKKKKGKQAFGSGAGSDPVSLARGTAFAAIGALLGAMVWAGIVIATDYHISFLAWGIGALSGIGMALGHEDDDGTMAGVIASCVALGGIFVGAMLVFSFWSPGGSYDDSDIAAEAIAEETIRRDGVDYDNDDEADRDAAYEEALADANRHVAAMSEAEVKARVALYEAVDVEYAAELVLKDRLADDGKDVKSISRDAYYEEYGKTYQEIALMSDKEIAALIKEHDAESGAAAEQQEADVAEGEDGDGGGGDSLAGYLIVFLLLFGFIRGPLFVCLALGTAYKLGSGRMTD